MKAMLQSLIRPVFGLLLVSSVATGAVATSARPAEAGVVVSVGIGFGGYAPAYYRPHRRVYHGYGRFGPPEFVAPVIYRRPAYLYRRPFGRPYYDSRFYRGYDYGRGYGYGHRRGYGYR